MNIQVMTHEDEMFYFIPTIAIGFENGKFNAIAIMWICYGVAFVFGDEA